MSDDAVEPIEHRAHNSTTRRLPYILGIVALILLGIAPIVIIWFVQLLDAGINDAYAKEGTAEMLISYMQDHNSNWPKNWDDLQPYFHRTNARFCGWSYEYYQSRINIDFQVDPQKLIDLIHQSDSTTFNVIQGKSLISGQHSDGPNMQLRRYFLTLKPSSRIEAP
jgi:hypothetical protein